MALSEVDICRRSLIKVHAGLITSLTEETEEAIQCNILFPQLRDEVLRQHFWNFAIKQENLQKLVDTPAFEFNYKYQLPSDYIRIRKLEYPDRYKIKGQELHTDRDGAKIEYVAQIADTTQFDPMFSTALSLRLAAELAYSLAGSSERSQQIYDEYRAFLKEAKRADGQEGTPDSLTANLFVDSRHEYGNNYPIDWTS